MSSTCFFLFLGKKGDVIRDKEMRPEGGIFCKMKSPEKGALPLSFLVLIWKTHLSGCSNVTCSGAMSFLLLLFYSVHFRSQRTLSAFQVVVGLGS